MLYFGYCNNLTLSLSQVCPFTNPNPKVYIILLFCKTIFPLGYLCYYQDPSFRLLLSPRNVVNPWTPPSKQDSSLAKFFFQLTIVHLDNLIGYLVDETYQDYVLDIMYSISNQVPIALEPYLCIFEKFTCYDSFKIDKIISTIGKSLKVSKCPET